VSYSFERIGKLLEERELRKISTSGTRSSLSRQDILEGGEKGRVDGVGRLKAHTLKPAWMRHPIIAPVGLEFSLHCFLQFVMHWGPPFLVERSIGSFWGTNKAAVEAPGRLQGPTSDGRLAICLHSSWYLFQERL